MNEFYRSKHQRRRHLIHTWIGKLDSLEELQVTQEISRGNAREIIYTSHSIENALSLTRAALTWI